MDGKQVICHHGIKGQKWGIRRFQNKDGSLTPEGRKRRYAANVYRYVDKTFDEVDKLVGTLSAKEIKFLCPGTGKYMNADEKQYVAKRFVERHNKELVAVLDVFYSRKGEGSIATVTKRGEKYRHKGYANKLVNKAKDWLNSSENRELLNMDSLIWFAEKDNLPSINLAKKNGFKYCKSRSDDVWWAGKYERE